MQLNKKSKQDFFVIDNPLKSEFFKLLRYLRKIILFRLAYIYNLLRKKKVELPCPWNICICTLYQIIVSVNCILLDAVRMSKSGKVYLTGWTVSLKSPTNPDPAQLFPPERKNLCKPISVNMKISLQPLIKMDYWTNICFITKNNWRRYTIIRQQLNVNYLPIASLNSWLTIHISPAYFPDNELIFFFHPLPLPPFSYLPS